MSFNELLKSEISELRNMGHQFLNGEISRNDLKGKSGGMGVYSQKEVGKFMIRLRTSSGVLSHDMLSLICSYAEKYKLDSIHLTTRQAIQLHELGIDDVCDIMYDAIDHELYTRGGGGNFPRNVALSPMSGVQKGEAFDVTPYALQVGKYLMSQITSYHLPRKLKIAFSSSVDDTACATLNDLGFIATVQDGKPYFKLYLAGGLGNNPATAIHYDKLVSPEDVLYHVEAMTQLFIAEGDYENKAKARIRYIPRRMGVDAFLACYEKHLAEVKAKHNFDGIDAIITQDSDWQAQSNNNNIIAQKQPDLYTVIIHPIGGQLKTSDARKISDFVSSIENSEVRLSMNEEMYIRNLTIDQANKLMDMCANFNQTTKVTMSVSCIGIPTCQMGVEKSQALLKSIIDATKDIKQELLPTIYISGCPNSCARHQASSIGFAGKKVKVGDNLEDVFELFIGGHHSMNTTELATSKGFILTAKIPQFIVDVCNALQENNITFEQLITENNNTFEALLKNYIV